MGSSRREVYHLPRAALHLALANRNQHGHRAVEARRHVRQRHRRQHRLAVSEAVVVRESRHRLHQRPEPRPLPVRPRLPEPETHAR